MKAIFEIFCILCAVFLLTPASSRYAEEELPIFPSPIVPPGFSQDDSSILHLYGEKPSDMIVFVRTLFDVPFEKAPLVRPTSVDLYYPIQTKAENYSAHIPLQMHYNDLALKLERIEILVTNKQVFFAADSSQRNTIAPAAGPLIYIYPSIKKELPKSSIIKSLSGSLDVKCHVAVAYDGTLIMKCRIPGQKSKNAYVPIASLVDNHSMEINFHYDGSFTQGADASPKNSE